MTRRFVERGLRSRNSDSDASIVEFEAFDEENFCNLRVVPSH